MRFLFVVVVSSSDRLFLDTRSSPATRRRCRSRKSRETFNVRRNSVVCIFLTRCKIVDLRFSSPRFDSFRPMMKLLEVIRTKFTSDETFETLLTFGKALGKTTVSCKVSRFSFICRSINHFIPLGYARFYRQSIINSV